MRYRWDKKYLYWGVTAVAVIIAGLLLFAAIFRFDMIWGFFGTIFGILTPVLYGFAFAFILNPVVKRLHKLFMKTVFKKTKKVHLLFVLYVVLYTHTRVKYLYIYM